MHPPSEKPNSVALSDPAASITAPRSSIRSSSVGSATRSDIPVPRLSHRITRAKLAIDSSARAQAGSSHSDSNASHQPVVKTRSRSPSPITW